MTNNKNYEILSIEENARTGGVCAEVRKDGAKYYFDLSNALTMQGFGPECMAFDIKPNGKPDFAWEKAVWYPPEISEAELLKCIEEFFEEWQKRSASASLAGALLLFCHQKQGQPFFLGIVIFQGFDGEKFHFFFLLVHSASSVITRFLPCSFALYRDASTRRKMS